MLKGFKTQQFFKIILLLLVIAVNLNAGWIEIKILHNNKTYVNNNIINLDIKTHELIAVKFIVHYSNTSTIDDYYCWVRDGYYGSLSYKYKFPEYAEKWKNKNITISPQEGITLENIVYIHPTYTSRDTVMVWYGEKTKGKSITNRWQKLIINVSSVDVDHPEIEMEPEFTPGTSNTITWYPVNGSSLQDVYYFDDDDPLNLRKTAQRLYKKDTNNSKKATIFESLQNGHKYGYFARSVIMNENDTLYMCSDITYSIQDNTPPEKIITIHADKKEDRVELTWKKVGDEISEVEKYIIFKTIETESENPVGTVYSSSFLNDIISWNDESFEEGKSFFYRVRGVDIVGNMGGGVKSNSIFISEEENNNEDSSNDNDKDNEYRDPSNVNKEFIRGPIDTLWIELSLEDTVQALRFEAVRDSMVYFDLDPPLNMRYFTSGWISPEVLRNIGWVSENNSDKVFFVFDYTDTRNAFVDARGVFHENNDSENIDANFVNGRTYIRRIISKYKITQDTVWLDKKIPDCFPPNDIHNFTGEAVLGTSGSNNSTNDYSEWYMKLKWEPANDEVSDVKAYHVYRKIDNIDQNFIKQGMVTSTEFIDTFNVFTGNTIFNPLITYKIASEDLLGNIREVNASDWEVQERSLQGPEIVFNNPGSDKVFPAGKDTLLTQKDFVVLGIKKFDISDVLKYEIDLNSTIGIQKNVNRSMDTLKIELPDKELSTMRVRVVYLGNIFSMWSNSLNVIRNFKKVPENFIAVNDSTNWDGDIKLSWIKASLDADKYEIFRNGKKIGVFRAKKQTVNWIDRYGIDELKNESGDTLTAYQNYEYKIRAINIFKEKSDFTPIYTTYCNRAPEIIKDEKKYENNNYVIKICWQRAIPSLLQEGEIKYKVKIYQDSLTNLFKKCAIIYDVNVDTICEDFQVPSGHNYIFRIREVPNSFPNQPSAWSKPYTVPDFSLFNSLESLALPGKRIFINWNNSEFIRRFKIDSFAITRSENDYVEIVWIFPSNIISFVDSSENLQHGHVYTYDIIAVDSLGQTLDTSSITDTCDSVAFIPDIDEEETPEYFKQDSLEVFWKWIDDINGKDIAQRTEGADSLAIQISISDNFPSIADQTITTDYFEADVNRSKKIQIPKLTSRRNEKIFIRITAKDKWEHNSISSKNTWWSNDFYSLKSAVYDTVPSPVVTDFRVKFNGSYNLASDSIMVNCTWSGEGVEQGTVDTNRTILWNAKSYRIIRKLNDQQWIQDEIPVQKDLDVYMYQKPTFNRDFKWQISVIDSAGNVTKGEWVISENFLETPEPPIPISYRSCKVPEVECDSFFVEIAMDPSHFSLAYRNSDIKDRLLCQIGWTRDDTCTCTTGWGSIKVDTTWFRVKVKKIMGNDTLVGVESAWSPVVAFSEGSSEAKNLTNIENNNSIQSFKLYSNRPNPFNNSTVIRYELPEKSDVKISIFNMRGSLVKQFSRNKLSSGSYCIEWDGTDMNYKNVSSGIYICFLMVKTEGGKLFKNDIKMLLIK